MHNICVFGKKAAERHRSPIETCGTEFSISHATDEMCSSKSYVWRPADNSATAFLKKKSTENECSVLYDQANLRWTKIIENAAQGDLFIMDYQNSDSSTLPFQVAKCTRCYERKFLIRCLQEMAKIPNIKNYCLCFTGKRWLFQTGAVFLS